MNGSFICFAPGEWFHLLVRSNVVKSKNICHYKHSHLSLFLFIKFSKMFPLNEKTHQMDTRKMEKFKVQHAHTDRLKNFALIHMQNLLNEQEAN